MNAKEIKKLLKQVKKGDTSIEKAMDRLKTLPFDNMGYARIDNHRSLRTGACEVIFCPGKTLSQIEGIVKKLAKTEENIMATRADYKVYEAIRSSVKNCFYYETARIVVINPVPLKKKGNIAVVSAGTSDIPVAEEAAVTAEILGSRVNRIYDAGVSGIHRILESHNDLLMANVAVVVAGMEGALASVVAGLVSCPVIGVPTSIGYGASFGGIAALLAMLNSCASGVSVVNIDNGFGAGFQAALINRLAENWRKKAKKNENSLF